MSPNDGDVDLEVGRLVAALRVDPDDDLGSGSQVQCLNLLAEPPFQLLAADEGVPLLERLTPHVRISRQRVQA